MSCVFLGALHVMCEVLLSHQEAGVFRPPQEVYVRLRDCVMGSAKVRIPEWA